MAEPRRSRSFQAGAPIYGIGADGLAWRVERGSVRLDTAGTPGEACFASLAISGDIIGSEAMLFGAYAFSASSLTHCEISPWPEGAPANVVLPTRQDIADITALRLETVSRIIKGLERAGMLHPVRVAGVHATRSFAVNFRHLAA